MSNVWHCGPAAGPWAQECTNTHKTPFSDPDLYLLCGLSSDVKVAAFGVRKSFKNIMYRSYPSPKNYWLPMDYGRWAATVFSTPLGNSKPMATQISLIKLSGSQNRIKRHTMEKDLYGGVGGGC